MSNGKGWTSQENPHSSDEDATRAVPRDQLMSAISPNSSRDHTRVAQTEVFPHQDPTKAINAEQFYQAAEIQENTTAFETDSSEEKTRALNTSGFNFQALKSESASKSRQANNQTYPQGYPQSQVLSNETHSENYAPPPPQAYPQSSFGKPLPRQPSALQYPSPKPREQTLSTLDHFHDKPKPSVQANSFGNFPSPRPKPNLSSEILPQVPTLDQAQALKPALPLEHAQYSSANFNQEDLTQAHLKSQALSELITEHKYQEKSLDESHKPFTSAQHASKRIKRSQLIIYSSIGLSVLIILVALSSTYLKAKQGIINRLNDKQISLVKLKAPYALELPVSLDDGSTQSSLKLSSSKFNSLLVFYTPQMLWYSDDQNQFENELALLPRIQKPQIHPLRLNGAFLPGLIHQLESDWPAQNLNQLILAASPSLSAGAVLDLLNTLSINHERKGKTFERYNLLIEKENPSKLPINYANKLPQQSSKTLLSQQHLAMLPFKILYKTNLINRNDFLQVKWNKLKDKVFVLGPKRTPRARFQLQSRSSGQNKNRLSDKFKEKINQIGALKGILITVPRSISLNELALWLSISAPYPVYLIPPKVSL